MNTGDRGYPVSFTGWVSIREDGRASIEVDLDSFEDGFGDSGVIFDANGEDLIDITFEQSEDDSEQILARLNRLTSSANPDLSGKVSANSILFDLPNA